MNFLGKSLPPLSTLLPFEAAARLGSFSRAADELHITQAAVSRQMRILESNIGRPLFTRRNRAVFLTETGQELARTVQNALRSIASCSSELRSGARKNEVILLCQLCEAFHWLMPRLSSFHHAYPEIELKVATSTKALTEFEGYFDVALQSTGRDHGNHPLAFTASDEVFPVCSPAYLGDADHPLEIKALSKRTLLHYHANPPHLLEWGTWLTAHGITLPAHHKGIAFDSYSLMLQAAIEGHGIAMGWQRTAARLIDSGLLMRPCKESILLPEAISVYRREGQSLHAETETLVEWLRAQLDAQP
ncbi:LysR family transcriptional regulator [Pseudomonas sp. v388]|uniref:LysR substrate-binding domain-containing protein n=1 Tax=Pseudomonas sp. v388 TaxID=2479849 RepID=UPI000F77AD74|nr:LysR substrate-binding domain-containing protein [Pseudomonas sp. v388]RRV10167.1 LysR family transcriptional regulator [Pseudomonas sp. v388]